jgi:hypothetical protein
MKLSRVHLSGGVKQDLKGILENVLLLGPVEHDELYEGVCMCKRERETESGMCFE